MRWHGWVVSVECMAQGEQSLQKYSGRELMMKTWKTCCLLSQEPYCKPRIQEDSMKLGGGESEKGKWLPSMCNWSGIIDNYRSVRDSEK